MSGDGLNMMKVEAEKIGDGETGDGDEEVTYRADKNKKVSSNKSSHLEGRFMFIINNIDYDL